MLELFDGVNLSYPVSQLSRMRFKGRSSSEVLRLIAIGERAMLDLSKKWAKSKGRANLTVGLRN
jgi:hypothetical protein